MKQTKVALVCVLSLACALNGLVAQGTSESSQKGEKIVLDFPTWQAEEGGFASFWKEMVKQFETSHPNVTINLNQIPFKQFTDTLTTRYSAGDAPDITHIASRYFDQFASQGWFEDLDPYFRQTDILDDWTGLQKSMLHDGKNKGLLVMGYGFVLYYNEKILSDAGIMVPTTVADLKKAVDKIEAMGDADIHAYGVTTQQHANVYQDFSNFVVGEGSALIKDGFYNISSPEVVQASKDYNYVASKAPKGVSTEMLRQLYVDGKIAMLVDGPWVASMIATAEDDIRPFLKIAKTPFPMTPGSISNSLHIAKTLPEKRKKLVFEFIEQVAKPENQILYSQLTQSPCGRISAVAKIDDPNLKFVNDATAQAVSIMPDSTNLMKNYSKYIDVVISSVLKLQDEKADVEGILAELQKNLEREGLEP